MLPVVVAAVAFGVVVRVPAFVVQELGLVRPVAVDPQMTLLLQALVAEGYKSPYSCPSTYRQLSPLIFLVA